MRIDAYSAFVCASGSGKRREVSMRFPGVTYSDASAESSTSFSRIRVLEDMNREIKDDEDLSEGSAEETSKNGSEAEKIYQAVKAGKKNPLEELRKAPSVPYEHLAKDGVINYNGVCFICDKKTNSICLGDMTDEKQVLNIPLSGGGHLKVNRANIGELSKAAGMFTPEDLNLIMRAIALDTKLQETKKEIDDMEENVGTQLGENAD